jgi:3-hydroxymyristoyl/3-hydroxydecanoyl-(acyl carrier protein) dehydratase
MDMPKVLEVESSKDKTRLCLEISADLDVFKGHFDKIPVVPGVVQIHWALEFCREYLLNINPSEIAWVEALKFQHVIIPDTRVELRLELANNKLTFSFCLEEQRYSSGKVVII